MTGGTATAELLARYDRPGPRYTSYPTAIEFHPGVREGAYRSHLARANEQAAEPLSMYVHLPFCEARCSYCGCNVVPTRDSERGIAYVDQLATEMTLLAGPLQETYVTELALGGGSPNFLAPRTLRTLVGAIERYFRVSVCARRSVELDPRATTIALLETLADLGFHAMSLGVQDFAEPVQDAAAKVFDDHFRLLLDVVRVQTQELRQCRRRLLLR
jgi:oxygen-independent coproporphyrinogen-3 oxidase